MQIPEDRRSLPSLLRRLTRYVSLDWIALALDLAFRLRSILCISPEGPYEILDYEATLELLDRSGKRATFRKRQRVRFLQDNILACEDYAWGDGDILAEYKVWPGVVADRYREGDRWNIVMV